MCFKGEYEKSARQHERDEAIDAVLYEARIAVAVMNEQRNALKGKRILETVNA